MHLQQWCPPPKTHCSELAAASVGLQAGVRVLVDYERRSSAVLGHLLGRSYSLGDLTFYAAGAAAALTAGAVPFVRVTFSDL